MSRQSRERALTVLLWVGVAALAVMALSSLALVELVAELVRR